MRKVANILVAAVLFTCLLSSCGLFKGGKSEKCPAYSSVQGSSSDSNTAEMPENGK